MRHLVIKNFGPIRNADLQLGQVNVLIGMQSSGKSCVLKTACYLPGLKNVLNCLRRSTVSVTALPSLTS